MKLEHLWVDDFKNLRECEIEFAQPTLLSAVIGGNGSGKSNLVEAILHILIGVYFKKAPPFNFEFRFESQRRQVTLKGDDGRLSTLVDGERVPLKYFAERLRGGPAQVYYPELTFVYYSGECDRVRNLIKRYRTNFQKLTRNPDTDSSRPLFVESTNQQAQVILLVLFAHRDRAFLKRLDVKGVTIERLEGARGVPVGDLGFGQGLAFSLAQDEPARLADEPDPHVVGVVAVGLGDDIGRLPLDRDGHTQRDGLLALLHVPAERTPAGIGGHRTWLQAAVGALRPGQELIAEAVRVELLVCLGQRPGLVDGVLE